MKVNNEITWEEIEKYVDKDSYKEFLKHISPSVFEEVKNGEHRAKILTYVLKVLQERDPQNATEEYAQNMVNIMQEVAKKIQEQKKNIK